MRILLLLFILLPGPLLAKPLVADLSQYQIRIDSSFTGTRLLLFGSRNDTGDIVVAVRGPEKTYVVRRKERMAGIWVNSDEERFRDVASYYLLGGSKNLADMRHNALFGPLKVGFDQAVAQSGSSREFSDALIRYMQGTRLYSPSEQRISFMGESLFKLVIPFPDNIPRGDYSADVYLFRDGALASMQSIPIHVEKAGADAFIYDFAHNHSVLYGLFAVLLALGMGWGASSLMRRL